MFEPVDIPASRLLLLDDHTLVVESFKELLIRILPAGCTIDSFTSVATASATLATQPYHFLLTDLVMPGENVKEFITSCRTQYPDMVIIVISTILDITSIKECLRMGVAGYLSKSVQHHEIRYALENTYHGRKYISNDLSDKLTNNFLEIENSVLTKKELEVVRMIAAGYSTKVAAEKLHISPITLMTHKRSILQKLGLHSSTELVKYAYDNHLN